MIAWTDMLMYNLAYGYPVVINFISHCCYSIVYGNWASTYIFLPLD